MAEAGFEIPLPTLEPKTSCVQRHATKKIHSPSSTTVPSRYLKASTGSCHDFCKYGRKHEVEAKSWAPIRKFIAARRSARNDQTTISEESKRKLKINSQNEASYLKEDLSALEGTDISAVEDPNNPSLKPKHSNSFSLTEHGCSINEKSNRSKEGKGLLDDQNNRIRNKNRSKEMRTSLLGERKILHFPTVSLSPKPSSRRVPSTITRKSQYKNKDEEPEHVPEKTLYIIDSTIENTTSEPTQDVNHTLQVSPSSTSTTQSILSSQTNSRYSSSGMPDSRSPPSPMSIGRKGLRHSSNKNNITERPLSSLESTPLLPTTPSEKLDSKENSITYLRRAKVLTEKKKPDLQAEYRIRARMAGKLASEKSSPARKVKFRRGTIIDLKQENNTPRRLKFRRVKFIHEIQSRKEDNMNERVQGKEGNESEFSTITKQEKVVTKNQNVERKGTTLKRSLRKKESNESELIGTKATSEKAVTRHQNMEGTTTRRRNFRRKDTNGSELAGTKMNSVKVVLRHQNVAGKKIVQSLFNNVIEETASKLVESRKSKVKALVGAFETVISLQDTNPLATSDAN
ncbi:uncharacterized protein LOC115709950 [Cannabis sativa]|uniref:uncharacterized protein LOC115709950 n=1 Tax=Cannabis sativa TaxID=3483 RepID=UPI0029CA8774|nr:uncharacterized protein LOC115709950 [Cannabis sativa]XP_030494081.2 uncharacterized protein LOC115709950 [Cannabis sativa]